MVDFNDLVFVNSAFNINVCLIQCILFYLGGVDRVDSCAYAINICSVSRGRGETKGEIVRAALCCMRMT